MAQDTTGKLQEWRIFILRTYKSTHKLIGMFVMACTVYTVQRTHLCAKMVNICAHSIQNVAGIQT